MTNRIDKQNFWQILLLTIIGIVSLAAAPFLIGPIFLMKVCCYALFACAFNLLLGFGGLISFGHAAFFGGGAYACAYALKVWQVPPELAIVFALLVSSLLGLAFAVLAIRRQGIYFAMVTLALAQLVYFFLVQASFTGGEDGIQGVPRGTLLGILPLDGDLSLYYVVVVLATLGFAAIYRIVHSPFGLVLKAIRDNERRAISLGYRVQRYKIIVFTLSAALSGLAGALKVLVLQLASLTDVHWTMSGEVILMTLLGGLSSVFGPALGATLIVLMQNYLASLGAWVSFVHGLIFVVCVLMLRDGMVGLLRRWIGADRSEAAPTSGGR